MVIVRKVYSPNVLINREEADIEECTIIKI
jgi:hypothetical protein